MSASCLSAEGWKQLALGLLMTGQPCSSGVLHQPSQAEQQRRGQHFAQSACRFPRGGREREVVVYV